MAVTFFDSRTDDSGSAPKLIDCRYGRMLINPNDIFIGQSLDVYGEFSPGETALYNAVLRPGDIVVDAGANVGAFTLCFSHAVQDAGRVYAFEPQRIVFQMLCANLSLNGRHNVEAWPVALGAEIGQMIVPPVDYSVPGNFGDVELANEKLGEIVPLTTIDNLGLDACALIKADVQGMECDILAGAADTISRLQPLLYLENDQRDKSAELLNAIMAYGYRAYWHLPSLFDPDNFRGVHLNLFPGTVSVNLLCTPPRTHLELPGLLEVRDPQDWWQDH